MSERDEFLRALTTFDQKCNSLVRILQVIDNSDGEPRRRWANLLFYRLGVIGNSLRVLCSQEPRGQTDKPSAVVCVFDPGSIATLARNLLEAQVLFLYATNPDISDAEWQLRRDILELHNCITRYKTSKDMNNGKSTHARDLMGKIIYLKRSIEISSFFRMINAGSSHRGTQVRKPSVPL
jgi:hypothetical protein